MDPALRDLLHYTNPWVSRPELLPSLAGRRLPATPLHRTAGPALATALADPRKAHLVVGPRQAGKSTLLWSQLAQRPRPLLYLNCEEPLVREWCRSPGLFLSELDAWLPEGGMLFLEEAQWLDEAGLFLKGLVDARTNRVVVATGSASFHLLSRTRESLAGRATYHHVWPFSLEETLASAPSAPPAARAWAAREAAERMFIYGGYPEAWTSENPASVLEDLVIAIVLRDASDRFRLGRPDAFRLLLRLAAGQVGDLVNLSEWGRVVGLATSTVGEYINLLEETHILSLIRPFLGGKRAELTSAPKVYFVDNGLRNAVAGGFEPADRRTDLGHLLENWVFSELHKRFPAPGAVRYWRTTNGAEVDFVLEPEPGRVIPIEVKVNSGPKPGVSRSMHSFIEAYAPSVMLGVYRGEGTVVQVGTTEVRWVPAWALGEQLERLGC